MAAATSPNIQVYASFPRTIALQAGANLDITPANWHWVHCLTLPVETLNTLQFSHRPYKWIRYAIGVVVGAEGNLSTSPNSPRAIDYNTGLPTTARSRTLYYHISNEEKKRMFPLDPDMARTNVTTSVTTDRRNQFREEVAERDGKTCVLSNQEALLCDAVHLLPHAKGSSYIENYTQRRSRAPDGGDIIQDIDSIQNGLFLNVCTHRTLGKYVAFLTTPNFAMDTTDIDANALPTERRHTVHLFQPGKPAFLGYGVILPCSIHISDSPHWPPAILFDAIYATTVIHHFGTPTLKDALADWKDTFYPGGTMTIADVNDEVIVDEQNTAVERMQFQAQEHNTHYETHNHQGSPDNMDMLMMMPYLMVPPSEVQAVWREIGEAVRADEQKHIEEKVNAWQKQVNAA